MRKRNPLFFLGALVLFALGAFFLWPRGDAHDHTGHHGGDLSDHDHGQDRSHAAHEEIKAQSGARGTELLARPEYQQPAEQPLIWITEERLLFEGPHLAPRFTAGGQHLLVTGESFQGLWISRTDGSGLRQISESQLAGWRPVTTEDGQVIFREADLDEQGNVYYRVKIFNAITGASEVIYSGRNEDVYPPWLSRDGDMVYILRDGEVVGHPLREEAKPLHERDEGFAYSDKGQVWYRLVGDGNSIEISNQREATGGEVASPCGRYVAYLSGNTDSVIIADLHAGTEVDIGEGSNLAWHPDSGMLLYDVTTDDGHALLGSELFVVEPDGRNRQRVTFNSAVAYHNPGWSPDGRQILVEDALTGQILLLSTSSSAPADSL